MPMRERTRDSQPSGNRSSLKISSRSATRPPKMVTRPEQLQSVCQLLANLKRRKELEAHAL